uniref:DNA-binding protein n=1 Tax=Siphoviridae sp. cti6f5 TaxID=2826430 RepID=A0A8S5MDC4_9CAUD|nr:MAG TPA: DNA-binding protein [Siphoviridae sp. cti6f5]
MVDKLIKEIEELLNSEISSYKIAKDSGVSYSLISDYRNSKRKIENMTLQVANKLIRYSEALKMRNYDKMMIVVNELVLEEGATVTYWTEENPNDCTCCYSVDELKAHLGNMNEDEYERLVFQVDYEEDEDRSYQFYMSEYKAVLDGDKFTLDCLHNTR